MSYLYYSIYKFILLTPSKDEKPEHIANIVLALILSLAIFGIIHILEYFAINPIDDFWGNKSYFIGMYIGFLTIGYYVFIRNNKFIALSQKFDSLSKKRKILNVSLVLSFLILLFFFKLPIDRLKYCAQHHIKTMLKLVSNRNSLLACSADCPADNHARQLAQFLYETLAKIL